MMKLLRFITMAIVTTVCFVVGMTSVLFAYNHMSDDSGVGRYRFYNQDHFPTMLLDTKTGNVSALVHDQSLFEIKNWRLRPLLD